MIKKFNSLQYDLVDRFLMHDFTIDILNVVEKKNEYIIFDIGCFKGKFSLKINEKLKNGKYYLFDANETLDTFCFKNLPFFKFFPIGVYDVNSIKPYYLNTLFPASGSSIDSLTKKDWLWNLTRRIVTLNFFAKYEKKEIQTITLDEFSINNKINFIDVLKIDVEGSELNVLKGSKNILNNTKVVLVEICDTKKNFLSKYEKIVSFLKRYDFKIIKEKKIKSYSMLSKQKAMDVLFVKI